MQKPERDHHMIQQQEHSGAEADSKSDEMKNAAWLSYEFFSSLTPMHPLL
jgi:hypothetical protein